MRVSSLSVPTIVAASATPPATNTTNVIVANKSVIRLMEIPTFPYHRCALYYRRRARISEKKTLPPSVGRAVQPVAPLAPHAPKRPSLPWDVVLGLCPLVQADTLASLCALARLPGGIILRLL